MAERTDDGHGIGLARRAGSAMAWGQAGKVLELLLTTAIAIIAVRALQPDAFGSYSLLTNLVGLASVFIPVVTTEALGAVLPRFRDSRERLYLVLLVAAARFSIIIGVSALVVPLWDVMRGELGLSPVQVKVLLAAAGYWAAQDLLNTVAGLYLAELNLRRVTLWRSVGQLATLLGLIALVLLDQVSVGSTIAVVATGYLVAAGALAAGLRKVGRPTRPPADQVRFVLGFTRNVWVIGVASLAFGPPMYVLLIGVITGKATEVAFYVAAVGVLGRAQVLLLSGWSALIIPSFGVVHNRDGIPGLTHAWRLFTKLWLIIAVPTSALLFVLADPLIHLLFGDLYGPSVSFLRAVAAFGFFTGFLSGPASVGVLWALDLQRTVVRVRMITTPLAVGLAVLLISRYDGLGAVIAAGVATVATSLAELVLARRAAPFSYPASFAGWTIVASAALVLPAVLLHRGGAISLVAVIVLGVLAMVGVAAIVRPFRGDDLEALHSVSPWLSDSVLRRFART